MNSFFFFFAFKLLLMLCPNFFSSMPLNVIAFLPRIALAPVLLSLFFSPLHILFLYHVSRVRLIRKLLVLFLSCFPICSIRHIALSAGCYRFRTVESPVIIHTQYAAPPYAIFTALHMYTLCGPPETLISFVVRYVTLPCMDWSFW